MEKISKIEKSLTDFANFVKTSPTPHFVVQNALQILQKSAGCEFINFCDFLQNSNDKNKNNKNQNFYFSQDGIFIAFHLGNRKIADGINILAAHTDSPCLKIKPKPENFFHENSKKFFTLSSEVYGGATIATFSDRDLSLAGRIFYQLATQKKPQNVLLDLQIPLCRLANLPIHLNRQVNENGLKFNKQTELNLLFSESVFYENFSQFLVEKICKNQKNQKNQKDKKNIKILSYDLLAYDAQEPSIWGEQHNFISSRQLDNLSSCYAEIQAFVEILKNKNKNNKTTILCLFNHEEVGSVSSQGAAGATLQNILGWIFDSQNISAAEKFLTLQNSFLISADTAHAFHPNFPQCYEPNHRCFAGEGVALKLNENQRYISNDATIAIVKSIAESEKIKTQMYVNRADLACGSTIGPTLATLLGIPGIDLGIATFAMHSCRETIHSQDLIAMQKLLAALLKNL